MACRCVGCENCGPASPDKDNRSTIDSHKSASRPKHQSPKPFNLPIKIDPEKVQTEKTRIDSNPVDEISKKGVCSVSLSGSKKSTGNNFVFLNTEQICSIERSMRSKGIRSSFCPELTEKKLNFGSGKNQLKNLKSAFVSYIRHRDFENKGFQEEIKNLYFLRKKNAEIKNNESSGKSNYFAKVSLNESLRFKDSMEEIPFNKIFTIKNFDQKMIFQKIFSDKSKINLLLILKEFYKELEKIKLKNLNLPKKIYSKDFDSIDFSNQENLALLGSNLDSSNLNSSNGLSVEKFLKYFFIDKNERESKIKSDCSKNIQMLGKRDYEKL